MNEQTWWTILAVLAGGLLGVVYFGGLWWTVQRIERSHWAGFLVLGSFLLRSALVLAGIYVVAAGSWVRVLCALVGFMVSRIIITRHFGAIKAQPDASV